MKKGSFPPQNMSLWHINYLKLIIFPIKKLILIGGKLLYNMVMVFTIHQHESATSTQVSAPPEPLSYLPPHPIPLGCSRTMALSALLHSSNLYWSSISHMILYMFQWYSFRSSHPHLLPQSPKVCSLHLCFFCCLAHRIVFIVFLNSINMH